MRFSADLWYCHIGGLSLSSLETSLNFSISRDTFEDQSWICVFSRLECTKSNLPLCTDSVHLTFFAFWVAKSPSQQSKTWRLEGDFLPLILTILLFIRPFMGRVRLGCVTSRHLKAWDWFFVLLVNIPMEELAYLSLWMAYEYQIKQMGQQQDLAG